MAIKLADGAGATTPGQEQLQQPQGRGLRGPGKG